MKEVVASQLTVRASWDALSRDLAMQDRLAIRKMVSNQNVLLRLLIALVLGLGILWASSRCQCAHSSHTYEPMLRVMEPRGLEHSRIESVRAEGASLVNGWLSTVYDKQVAPRYELLYRATEVGCHSYTFHRMCDGRGPTVTLVETQETGRVLGGFTSTPWSSHDDQGQYAADPKAFLFSLTQRTLHPIKHKDKEKAVWHHPDHLVYFGSYDFYLEDNCFKKEFHDQALGHSY